MSNGKGSARRRGKPGAYERGYEAIDWSKGRKPVAPRKVSVSDVLRDDYTAKVEWVIPSFEELFGPSAYQDLTDLKEALDARDAARRQEPTCGGGSECTNPPAEEHTCPYAKEINCDSERLCTCCPDCTHACAMNI